MCHNSFILIGVNGMVQTNYAVSMVTVWQCLSDSVAFTHNRKYPNRHLSRLSARLTSKLLFHLISGCKPSGLRNDCIDKKCVVFSFDLRYVS